MKITQREFQPVLLGSDINTYSMSRAFYEAYGVRSIVIGKVATGPSCNSRIAEFRTVPGADLREPFLRIVKGLASEFADKKVILLGCGDNYVEQIILNKAQLPSNFIAPYVDKELMDNLLTKLSFYGMCDKYGISYPGTFIYDSSMKEDFSLPFGFPIIVKPSNGVKYFQHEFPTQKKVYKLKSAEELKKVIGEIYASGYDDKLIIQDFIPGDDSKLRVMMCYSGKDRKVRLMSLAHVMLEEHTPHGLGNTAVLTSDYDRELSEMLGNFLENIGYTGYSTFDIKFDSRDGRFKILEINLRQGRSNYYVTAAGNNFAKCVVEDYIENKPAKLEIANARNLWTSIPLRVAFRYVEGKENLELMRQLVSEGRVTRPLFMEGDMGLRRRMFLYKNQLSHYFKFRKYMK
ncbi:MAG TPA: ATP-grasp domain-containing protein [Clostridia bacterium]|nr:ATP-grasp domain-containing protein [Clostridia bacterium]